MYYTKKEGTTMKKVISFVFAALAALFMAVSVGVISADELPFNDLVTEISVVDDTNEIIEKNNNGGFVTTEVGGDYTVNDLVTSTEEPKSPVVPEEPTNPVVPEVEQPEKPKDPSTPVVEEPSTPVETPSTPVETPELPIAELVIPPAPVEEPTKPSTPVEEKPVDDTPVIEKPVIPAPVVDLPVAELVIPPVEEKPVDPAPVIEKPELPVKPTPAPVVEKPEVPAEPTPTPAVEVPELPVTAEPTPEPTPTPVRSEQKMVELPYTGTQESIVSLVLAAFLLLMAGYIKKEFA